MNIDVEKLSEELTTSNKIIEIFNNASMKVSEVPNAGGNSNGYRVNIMQNIELCASDIAMAASELRKITQDMRDANRKTEEEVGLLEGLFEFFLYNIKANSAMQQQNDLLNAAALAGMTDEELANALLNAAREQGLLYTEYANKANEEGIRLGATVVNGFMAIFEGVVGAGEMLVDGLLNLACFYSYVEALTDGTTYASDPDSYYTNLKNQEKLGVTVMEKTATEWTEEKFVKLYEKEIMKKIDENAYMVHGDEIYMMIDGVTQCISIGTLMTICPAAPFISGVGKGAEEAALNMKNNSKEGISDRYQKGEISYEEYEIYQTYWNMPDEGFEYMKNNAFRLGIKPEEIAEIEKIRNMPDEWKTKENFEKTLAIGAANGVWEMAQYALSMNNKGVFTNTARGNAIERVVMDGIINGSDIPYRSLVTSAIMGTSYTSEYNIRGGDAAVLENVKNGLFASTIGEFLQANATRKTDAEIKLQNDIIETLRDRDYLEFLSEQKLGTSAAETFTTLKYDLENGKLDIYNPALQNIIGIDPNNLLSESSWSWLKEDINSGKVNSSELVGVDLADIYTDYFNATTKMAMYNADGTIKYLQGVVGKSEIGHIKDALKQDVLAGNTSNLDANWRTIIDNQGGDSTKVILDSNARFQKEKVKQVAIEYYKLHPELGVTTKDIEKAFENYHYYESASIMREDYLKKTGKNTNGTGVHNGGEVYISGALDDVDIAHEINHSLRYGKLLEKSQSVPNGNVYKIDVDNGMRIIYDGTDTKLSGINEVMTEINAQKEFNVNTGHSAYEASKEYVTRLNDILTEAGYDDAAGTSYYLISGKKNLQEAITDIYGNTDFLGEFDRLIQDVYGNTPSAVKEIKKAQLNAMLDSLESEVLR